MIFNGILLLVFFGNSIAQKILDCCAQFQIKTLGGLMMNFVTLKDSFFVYFIKM